MINLLGLSLLLHLVTTDCSADSNG